MKYLLDTIIDTIKYQWVDIQLPPTTEKLFYHYGFELEMVEPQEFMINSIKNYIDYNGTFISIRYLGETLPCIYEERGS